MRIQEAIVQQLRQTSTATYAIVAARSFWAAASSDPTAPFVVLWKEEARPLATGLSAQYAPKEYIIRVLCVAKSADGADDLADAVTSDLQNYSGLMPGTSPATAGALTVKRFDLTTEEDVISDELREKNLFAQARTFTVEHQ